MKRFNLPECLNPLALKAFFRRLSALSISLCLAALTFSAFPGVLMPMAHAEYRGYGFAPQRYNDGSSYGSGIYFAPYDFTLYETATDNARVIGQVHWSRDVRGNSLRVTTSGGQVRSVAADHMFFCFYPAADVAMMSVIGDNGQGWVEVVYDQERKKTAWVHIKETKDSRETADGEKLAPLDTGVPAHFGVYQTWAEFMKLNAKASGIYWLSGVDEYNRSIRYSDADDAKIIPITIIRQLKVKYLRGNWLLVEALDFERNTPIGWVRWRDDDGNLMVFPNISGQHLPVVTTAY